VTTLAAVTPELLKKARLASGDAALPGDEDAELDRTFIPGAGSPISSGAVQELLNTYARLLVQCLEVSAELHEGLLHCLAQVASDEVGRAGLAPYAKELVELCTSHLTETPSAQPAFVSKAPVNDARSESPPRLEPRHSRELTRDLALVCCACLRNLAEAGLVGSMLEASTDSEDAADGKAPERAVPAEVQQIREKVLAALGRENLNLQRLTRGHEPLRRGIAAAKYAWERLGGASPPDRASSRSPSRTRPASASRPVRNRAVSSALAMRDLLEAPSGRPRRGRSPDAAPRGNGAAIRLPSEGEAEVLARAAGADAPAQGGVVAPNIEPVMRTPAEDAMPKTIHPSFLEEVTEFEAHPAATSSSSSSSFSSQAAPASSDACAGHPPPKASQKPRNAAGPAGAPSRGRTAGPLCGAGPMPPATAEQAIQAVQKKADSSIQAVAVKADAHATPGPGFLQEQHLAAPQPIQLVTGLEDPPVLASVLDFLAKGRLDLAMQCVFNLGNERTLRALLQRLDSRYVWKELPAAEARHLARLLVALVCRDPRGAAASEVCPWLDALLCSSRNDLESLLPHEELPALQGALFSIAGASSTASSSAARVYYQIYHRGQAGRLQSQQGPVLRSLSAVPAV